MKQKKKNKAVSKSINFNKFGLGLYKKNFSFNLLGINKRITITKIKVKKKKIIKNILTQSKKNLTKKKTKNFILFFKKLRNIRGIRHKQHKPVRGQRTKTNAKTRFRKYKKKIKKVKKNRKNIKKIS